MSRNSLAFSAVAGALAGAAVLACGPAVAAEPIAYRLSGLSDASGALTGLQIELRLTGDADGRTRFALPSEWGGARGLEERIADVSVTGASFQRDGAQVEARHAPRAPITLRYRVALDERDPDVRDGPAFRPAVRPDWFTVVGWTVFAEVEGRRADPVRFEQGETPRGFRVVSDLEHRAGDASMSLVDLMDSVTAGGRRLYVLERPNGAARLRVAFQGDWRLDEAATADLLAEVANASGAFWGDPGEDFLAVATPLTAPEGRLPQMGVGLGDAFAIWTPSDTDADLAHILAHEYQHLWVPTRLGGVANGPDEPGEFWFSEGFTDFYTLRMLVKAGVWGPETFVADLNRILAAYAASPARQTPAREVASRFYSERAVQELPYQQGLLLAAAWDHSLRARTGGRADLDDAIRAVREGYRKPGPFGRPAAIPAFRRAYARLGGEGLDREIDRHVERGEPVVLPADLFGECARVVTTQRPEFDRGFDADATSRAGGRVAGVDPTGPAYAAGLRDGVQILGLEAGVLGDSRAELAYRVEIGGTSRLIRYRPEGRRTQTVQEVILADLSDPAKRARCTAMFAGD